jgi:hypothetical protein
LAPLLDAFAREKGPERLAPVREVRAHLARMQLRAQLVGVCRALVPGHEPPPDEPGLLAYPTEAAEALERAAALLDLANQRKWMAPLVVELARGKSPSETTLAGLKEYLNVQQVRQALQRANRELVPGYAPPASDAAQVGFPPVALTSFQKANQLQTLAETHSWLGDILDVFLAPQDAAHPGRCLDDLDNSLVRGRIVKSIEAVLSGLAPYLKVDGLREPYRTAKKGQTILPWADALEKGLDGFEALRSLDSDRHAGRVRARSSGGRQRADPGWPTQPATPG